MVLPPEYQKARDIYHDKGYEAAWKYWKLLGKTSAIFLGEVPSEDFITGDDLADRVGITEGVSQFSDTPWLKFILDFNVMYVPMKPIRHSISWDHIYSRGVVYENQNTIVTIGGFDFRVTLLRGANQDPYSVGGGYDPCYTHGSEWNKLMYPIHIGSGYQGYAITPSESFNQWASYTDDDLLVDYRSGNGTYSWCQESNGINRLNRGSVGVSRAPSRSSSNSSTNVGWRVALRLVR